MKFGLASVAALVVSQQVELGPYPGYTGDLNITGTVSASYNPYPDRDSPAGTVFMGFDLHGYEVENCKTVPEGVSNACGIHIHSGKTCDDASMVGGHYYSDSIESDPWAPITYSSFWPGPGLGIREVTIGAAQDITGRAMVVHDSTGARVACALVESGVYSFNLGPYPGYTGDLKVNGYVDALYHTDEDTVYISYILTGIEAEECKSIPAGVSNACGVHIHAGHTCDDASMVGGHYYSDSIESDPWAPVTYRAGNAGIALGRAAVKIGVAQDISGRAMVVHDSTGARIACALLPATLMV